MENREIYISKLISTGMNPEQATAIVDVITCLNVKANVAYRIRIDYTTGDSFNSYETDDTLEYTWYNSTIVMENINRINDYFNCINDLSICYNEKHKNEIIDKIYNSSWVIVQDEKPKYFEPYFNDKDGKYIITSTIKLLKDDGTEFKLGTASFTGHFESSQHASVITEFLDNMAS